MSGKGSGAGLPIVKICCIASVDEARLALHYGAAALGLVSEMPSGPGPIPEERIREIARAVPASVDTFLLTSRTDPESIAHQCRRAGTTTVQLVDRLAPEDRRRVRRSLPGVRVVQVVHVTGPESVEEARAATEASDAILLDSGRREGPQLELGGTGRVHDWDLSRRIREEVDRPVYLAGGLRSGNVEEAIRRVRPYGLDLCTGVRREGRLDEERLGAFMAAVRGSREA